MYDRLSLETYMSDKLNTYSCFAGRSSPAALWADLADKPLFHMAKLSENIYRAFGIAWVAV